MVAECSTCGGRAAVCFMYALARDRLSGQIGKKQIHTFGFGAMSSLPNRPRLASDSAENTWLRMSVMTARDMNRVLSTQP